VSAKHCHCARYTCTYELLAYISVIHGNCKILYVPWFREYCTAVTVLWGVQMTFSPMNLTKMHYAWRTDSVQLLNASALCCLVQRCDEWKTLGESWRVAEWRGIEGEFFREAAGSKTRVRRESAQRCNRRRDGKPGRGGGAPFHYEILCLYNYVHFCIVT